MYFRSSQRWCQDWCTLDRHHRGGVRMCTLDRHRGGVRTCTLDRHRGGVRKCTLDRHRGGFRTCTLDRHRGVYFRSSQRWRQDVYL